MKALQHGEFVINHRLSVIGLFSLAALFSDSVARADVMPWSGASASVQVLAPSSTQSGSTASVSAQNTIPVNYLGVNYGDGPLPQFTVNVNGSADASATGQANALLQVGATFYSPNPGSRPDVIDNPNLTVQSTASWNNDSLSIHGASIPNMVRLNFAVDFTANSPTMGNWFGAITITANGQTNTLGLHYYTGPLFQQGFDSVTVTPSNVSIMSHYDATFHLDLPVSALGLSDPFHLSLQATPDSGLQSNFAITTGMIGDATLSLNSITTTDGTLLSDLGDTVTFASGMAAPVPEPSSFLIMGGLVVMFAAAKWRRS